MAYYTPISPSIADDIVQRYGVRSPLGGEPEWIVAVDLGKQNDPTVVTVWKYVVKTVEGDAVLNRPDKVETSLLLCKMDEYLRMPYVEIRARIKETVTMRPIAHNMRLIVDQSGVGEAVVDDMRHLDGLPVIGIQVVQGKDWHPVMQDKDTRFRRSRLSTVNVVSKYIVGKISLVTSAIDLLQQKKLLVAKVLNTDAYRNRLLHEALERQIAKFTMKNKDGTVRYENLTSDVHDDIVSCVLMTAWWAKHFVSSFSTDADKVVVRKFAGGGSGYGYGRYQQTGESVGFDTYGGIK